MIERILTIGIPTFNRIKAITSCMEFFEKKNLPEEIEILVIDNNSSDGTFKFLSERFTAENIRILKNKENLGFSGNTLQLIKECRTNYLLWNQIQHCIQWIHSMNFSFSYWSSLFTCSNNPIKMYSPRQTNISIS